MKLSGLRGVMSPMPRIVMTTVSSLARSMSLDCSSVGIFLNSSASESAPSLLKPAAVIWKWNVRPLGALPFTSSAETLQAGDHGGRQVRGNRRARHADVQIRAQMRDQVRAHAMRGAAGERLLECGERHARGLDCAERDHHGALPAVARRRERDIDGAAVLPDAHAGHAHPVVGLRLGDELLTWQFGTTISRLRASATAPMPSASVAREPRRTDQARARR